MDSSRITIKKIKNKASIRFLAANGIFRLSVRLSHFFLLCSHHRIIMKISGVITND